MYVSNYKIERRSHGLSLFSMGTTYNTLLMVWGWCGSHFQFNWSNSTFIQHIQRMIGWPLSSLYWSNCSALTVLENTLVSNLFLCVLWMMLCIIWSIHNIHNIQYMLYMMHSIIYTIHTIQYMVHMMHSTHNVCLCIHTHSVYLCLHTQCICMHRHTHIPYHPLCAVHHTQHQINPFPIITAWYSQSDCLRGRHHGL